MPAPQRTARIEDEIWDPAQARAKAEGASLGALMRAAGDLTSNAEPASQPPAPPSQALPASQHSPALVTAMTDGEPSPGTLCMGPDCFQRDTRTDGLRNLPLCTTCSAAPQGHVHKRNLPAGAARTIRRGTAA